ncbi:hypothetical protein WISP_102347 [Willisornis vidua]|uniref:Rna-directed dna polymerase from mobile element jockey-like n=1 Tax=Willisornis vidua TaxID=1566151 RepID=A0ABQ9D2M5_9PASS|nr:hypothetical protein WISP_102347 [Willisornis vidua]
MSSTSWVLNQIREKARNKQILQGGIRLLILPISSLPINLRCKPPCQKWYQDIHRDTYWIDLPWENAATHALGFRVCPAHTPVLDNGIVMGLARILLDKMSNTQLDKHIMWCVRNWLMGQAERVIVKRLRPDWRPITGGIPQDSILGPVFFNIFINDSDSGLEGILCKSADDTKLGGAADSLKGREAPQRDLNKSEDWGISNQIDFKIMELADGDNFVRDLTGNNAKI